MFVRLDSAKGAFDETVKLIVALLNNWVLDWGRSGVGSVGHGGNFFQALGLEMVALAGKFSYPRGPLYSATPRHRNYRMEDGAKSLRHLWRGHTG